MLKHTRTLFDQAPYQSSFKGRVLAIGELGIALDQTLFYPTGGGQPGDQGHFILPDGSELAIFCTQRDPLLRSIIWHQIDKAHSAVQVNMDVQGYLDWELRYRRMRMHTCLHLLSAIVDAPVTGCSMTAEKGRLDFDLPELNLDKSSITERLNKLIKSALEVRTVEIPVSEITRANDLSRTRIPPAMNHEAIRVIEISGVDTQLCGGTHVQNTAEIGSVVCDRIEKKSRLNRRITLRFA